MVLTKADGYVDDYTDNNLRNLPFFIKYRWTDSHRMNFHSHHGYEMFFLHKGSGNFVLEDHIYWYQGNDLILIKEHEIHKSTPTDNAGLTRTVINFIPEFVDSGSQSKLLEIFNHSDRRQMILSEEEHAYLDDLLERMNDEYTLQLAGFEQVLSIFLNRLLSELYRLYMLYDNQRQSEGPDNIIVQDLMKYLSKHYSENIPLDDLAKMFYITPFYLCHLFKKTTGATISQFVLDTRIHHAKKDLIFSDLSISQISQRTGFNSPSYFSSFFKKRECLTPKDYRKKYQQTKSYRQ